MPIKGLLPSPPWAIFKLRKILGSLTQVWAWNSLSYGHMRMDRENSLFPAPLKQHFTCLMSPLSPWPVPVLSSPHLSALELVSTGFFPISPHSSEHYAEDRVMMMELSFTLSMTALFPWQDKFCHSCLMTSPHKWQEIRVRLQNLGITNTQSCSRPDAWWDHIWGHGAGLNSADQPFLEAGLLSES